MSYSDIPSGSYFYVFSEENVKKQVKPGHIAAPAAEDPVGELVVAITSYVNYVESAIVNIFGTIF
jgi:hypothetical protein